MIKYFTGLVFCLVMVCAPLSAQHLDYKLGELIVQFEAQTDVHEAIEKFSSPNLSSCTIGQCISHSLGVYKIDFDQNTVNQHSVYEELKKMDIVQFVQYNHFLTRRAIPDDPDFDEQWHWLNLGTMNGVEDADIDADQAWDLTTGGVTAEGDTIVIGLIENGLQLNHPDLIDNMWINNNEIPNNGRDDDENGFIDDHIGWNVVSENDDLEPEIYGGGFQDDHGTKVAGMMGAVGNNGTGIAGVNWSVKIMNVKLNPDLNEADMLAAYDYILTQRRLYNETDGAKGAFVVSTNLSYGDENLSPEDAPIWCSMYDELGKAGIVNTAATANSPINIDVIKDIPTSCPSDHLISVTSSDRLDRLEPGSAFGAQDIDLIAPGEGVYSTTTESGYDVDFGTSFAAPQVAAAVALMYAVPNPEFIELAKSNPEEASLLSKQIILSTVDPIETAKEKVVSEGRLNLFKAVVAANNLSELECQAVSNFAIEELKDTLMLSWTLSEPVSSMGYRYRVGSDSWQEVMTDTNFTSIGIRDLLPCNSYEFQAFATCPSLVTSFSDTLMITTPAQSEYRVEIDHIGKDSVVVKWDLDSGVHIGLDILLGDSLIFQLVPGADTVIVENLTPCTDYTASLITACDTLFAPFMTQCAECTDTLYDVPSENELRFWIEHFSISTMTNTSGNNNGYAFFEEHDLLFERGDRYPVEIESAIDNSVDSVLIRYTVAIDLNQNASFEGDEILYMSGETSDSLVSGTITIPTSAKPGQPRLRVILHRSADIDLNEPVDAYVEDYCIQIIENCPVIPALDSMIITSNSAYFQWSKIDSAIGYAYRYKKQSEDEDDFVVMVDTSNFVSLSDLDDCEEYDFQIMTVCDIDTSRWEAFDFMTRCPTSVVEVTSGIRTTIFPNPFQDQILITIEGIDPQQTAFLRVFTAAGQQVDQFNLKAASNNTMVFPNMAQGVYYAQIIVDNQILETKKLVKL